MSRRSSLPAHSPVLPNHARNAIHPAPSHTPGDEITIDSVFNDLSSSLASLDFDRFFKIFHLESPVCRFVENLKPAELKALMLKAFPPELNGEARYNSNYAAAAKETRRAKKALDVELHDLESMFKIIEEAGLNVGTVRSSLRWMRGRNRRSLEKLELSLSQEASPYSENVSPQHASPKTPNQVHSPRYAEIPKPPVFSASSMTPHERDTIYKSLFSGHSSPRGSRKDHSHPHETERKNSHSRRHSEFPGSAPPSTYSLNSLLSPSPTPDRTDLHYTYNCLLNGFIPPEHDPSYTHTHAASGVPSQTVHSPSSKSHHRRRESLPASGLLQARNPQAYPYPHSHPHAKSYNDEDDIFVPPPPSPSPPRDTKNFKIKH